MQKVIYRGFAQTPGTHPAAKASDERMYRGVRFLPTKRKIVSPQTGETLHIYRGIVSA